MSSIHLRSFALLLMATTIYGERRELIPLEAPANLTLLAIRGHQVLVEWDPVEPKSVRGSFKGYLVRIWSHAGSQVYVFPPDMTRANVDFFPHAKNFITVSVRNDRYVGSPSEAISFDAPQIEPNPPLAFELFGLSNKSVLLRWKKPRLTNGVLLGYKIYCSEIDSTVPDGKTRQISHRIDDPEKLQAKLTGLQQGVNYKFGISALNCAGESDINELRASLGDFTPAEPSPSKFIYKINYTVPSEKELCFQATPTSAPEDEQEEDNKKKPRFEYDYYDYLVFNETQKTQIKVIEKKPKPQMDYEKRCIVNCMILWLPDVRNQPGEYFYVQYRVKGEEEFQATEPEMSEDFMIIANFDACKTHELMLTAVDGEYSTNSNVVTTPALYYDSL